MFRDPVLGAGFAMSTLVTTVVMATLVVGPFYLSGALARDAARVGLVMSSDSSVLPMMPTRFGIPGYMAPLVVLNLGLITGASAMGTVFALGSATTNVATAGPEAVAAGMRITFAVAAVLIVVALVIASVSRRASRPERPAED